jgi:cation diffusion facilitator family transporter
MNSDRNQTPAKQLDLRVGSDHYEAGERDERIRLVAVGISLGLGICLLGVKLWAYKLTASTAVLSDALESIVNVVAAVFAFGGVLFAGRPADRSHPYGHGKIEFFTAAFEGGLISFAAVLILYEAARGFLHGEEPRQLDLGLVLILGSGLVNALLGWFLMRTGRRYRSLTLLADGKHVLADFWTSFGVVAGLLLMRLTGMRWCDPAVAAVVGLNLAWTGGKLVRHAAGGLLDEEDPELLKRLVEAGERVGHAGIIRLSNLRAIRAGRFHHVDAHLTVPEFWDVERAHEAAVSFERRVMDDSRIIGEIVFHTCPCRQLFCSQCDLPDCPVRRAPFLRRWPLTLEEAVRPEPTYPES